MTMPRFHPSESLLVQYAAGALESGKALVLATHLSACPDCRGQLRLAEAVGGALMNDIEPEALAVGALASALARLDGPAGEPPPSPGPPNGPAGGRAHPPNPPDWIVVPPDVLQAALRRKRWAAPGVWMAPVTHDASGRMTSYLLRVGAGMAVPRHSHRGEELTCIVKGAFKDRGHIYRAGDLAETDESVEHQPRVTRDDECVCLIAADGRLVPRDWVGRLFQPLVGI